MADEDYEGLAPLYYRPKLVVSVRSKALKYPRGNISIPVLT